MFVHTEQVIAAAQLNYGRKMTRLTCVNLTVGSTIKMKKPSPQRSDGK